MHFVDSLDIHASTKSMSLSGSSPIRRFEGNDAIKIRDGITFEFYTGLPHILEAITYMHITMEAQMLGMVINCCNINYSDI